MNIKILAFDQSTTATGWCLFDESGYKSHGLIDLHKNKDMNSRLKEMSKSICKCIDENKPDLVYIEETAMQSNPKTLRSLSQLQGMIMGFCFANNIQINIIKPTEWRKAIGIKQGRLKRPELKAQAKDFALNNFGIKTSEDECEAVCICQAAFIINKIKGEI